MESSGKANKIKAKDDQQNSKSVENLVTTNEIVSTPDQKAQKEKKEKLPTLTHPEQKFDLLKNKGVSVVAFLDTVRLGSKSIPTVRLRIIYKRFPKFYTTKMQMSVDNWKKVIGLKPRGDLKEKKVIIFKVLRNALEIIYSLDKFSFEEFEKQFFEKDHHKDDVFAAFEFYRKYLKENERLGNENMYHYAQESLQAFHDSKLLSFKSITVSFLKRYEAQMVKEEKSLTTLGMYLRCLRFLYNEAIKEGIVKKEDYPFGKGRYEIPRPQNIKKALTLADVGKIYKYKPKNPTESFFRDIWLFSYLCNGINMKDICQLKYSDIKGEHIHYRRAKTINTDRNSKAIDIVITDKVNAIIDQWGTKPVSPESYIFSFLNDKLTAEQKYVSIRQATATTNNYMKNIATALEIKDKITTYSARHTFATVLKRSGVNIAFISEAMGHADIKTTENYLDSFEDEQKKEIAKKLTAW